MLSSRDHCNQNRLYAPLWSWPNLISVDAVAVGVAWNVLFTYQYCGRFVQWHESIIIGLSIWLVYTADRLFDAISLDTSQPHSARHRFHLDFRLPLTVLWFLLLLVNAIIIALNATPIQLRWGCLAIALAIAYVASAQWLRGMAKYFPKELQVGCVFAFGTSLTAWSEVDQASLISLLAATILTAAIFALNCIVIANGEREMDSRQGFPSLIADAENVRVVLPTLLLVHAAITVSLVAFSVLSVAMALTISACDGLLYLLMRRQAQLKCQLRNPVERNVWASPVVMYADLAVLAPPAILSLSASVFPLSAFSATLP